MEPKAEEISDVSGLNGLDQIRDIIFGELIAQWQAKFEHLEQNIKNVSTELSKQIQDLAQKSDAQNQGMQSVFDKSKDAFDTEFKDVRQEIKQLKAEIDAKLEELAAEKVDRDSIGEVFIQWGQRVKAQ